MEVARAATDRDLTSALDRAASAMAAASAEILRTVAEYDRRKLWRRDGATSMSSWLAGRYGIAWGTAREWVRVAHALQGLPRIAEAYAGARLSWDQLRPLTRFATPETDVRWAREAPDRRPASLVREARRHERIRTEDAREIHRRRYLWIHWDHEVPALHIEGMLPAEQGTAVKAALERRAAEVVLEEPPAGPPQDARMADAFVELVAGRNAEQAPSATLVLHAGAEVLAGEESDRAPWLAETDGGQRVASGAVRRLACDARIEWVLEWRGRPVGIGRRGRAVPGQLLRVLRHRDQVCRFPGCERKRWLNAHHLVHWADGGATNVDNLVLLCHAHHRLIHEGGWRISGHPGRDLRFHDPTGRALRRGPPVAVSRAPL
ncbi:MAG TPA: DUF222 domain-containing protein [Actinomycetota bacterium]|nr:DUF222 domain-containing protein [Actinomycetota bacterium]